MSAKSTKAKKKSAPAKAAPAAKKTVAPKKEAAPVKSEEPAKAPAPAPLKAVAPAKEQKKDTVKYFLNQNEINANKGVTSATANVTKWNEDGTVNLEVVLSGLTKTRLNVAKGSGLGQYS